MKRALDTAFASLSSDAREETAGAAAYKENWRVEVAGTEEDSVLMTMDRDEEVDAFRMALNVGAWDVGALPQAARAVATFRIYAVRALALGEQETLAALSEIARLVVYDACRCVVLEAGTAAIAFTPPEGVMRYLRGLAMARADA